MPLQIPLERLPFGQSLDLRDVRRKAMSGSVNPAWQAACYDITIMEIDDRGLVYSRCWQKEIGGQMFYREWMYDDDGKEIELVPRRSASSFLLVYK